MNAFTKKMALPVFAVSVFLIVSSSFARRYDTMMVGYDRWIDIGYEQESQDDPQKECRENQYTEVIIHSYYGEEPNSVSYLNYQDYEPNLPKENDPNKLYYPWPPDPNDVIDETVDPNEITEEEDPNDTENQIPIILDYGTAKNASSESMSKLSFLGKFQALKE